MRVRVDDTAFALGPMLDFGVSYPDALTGGAWRVRSAPPR
jgi:hypothetical protein